MIDAANVRLDGIADIYRSAWRAVFARKLGIDAPTFDDDAVIEGFLQLIQGADFTQSFRALEAAKTDASRLSALIPLDRRARLDVWLAQWRARALQSAGQGDLNAVNPAAIPRNHMVQAALDAAEGGDMAPFLALLEQLQNPFAPEAGREAYCLPAPTGYGRYTTYCGT